MLATVYSGAVYGVDAYSVEIEVNAGHGALRDALRDIFLALTQGRVMVVFSLR